MPRVTACVLPLFLSVDVFLEYVYATRTIRTLSVLPTQRSLPNDDARCPDILKMRSLSLTISKVLFSISLYIAWSVISRIVWLLCPCHEPSCRAASFIEEFVDDQGFQNRRRRHPQRSVRQCRALRRHDHFPRDWRARDAFLRVPRRKHHHCWRQALPCAGVLLPPSLIYQCDVDIRKDLHANVVFSGGTTIFPRDWSA